ncbi:HAD-IIB family hydrolase [Oenococcus alcoholitolerans]|uniref:HAD-IIB family hydrolase n=1 Tax=Oenococcus alcoholitolerans TaxID=931074 RepID=UPI003F6FE25C
MPIKLFATDFDGTFLDDKKDFDHKLFDELMKKLVRQGKFFTAASGRSYNGISHPLGNFVRKYPIYFVSQNGASVFADGKNIFRSVIDQKTLKEVFLALPELSVKPNNVTFEGDTKTYVPAYQPKAGLKKLLLWNPKINIINDFSEIEEPIEKVAIFWKDTDQKLMAEELISKTKIKGVRATSSGYGAIDLINRGISKAIGLQKLATYLGIHHDSIAAFGDGENDLEMLYYAAFPYVMPNAPEFMKENFNKDQIAVDNNNNNGVLKTIKNILDK